MDPFNTHIILGFAVLNPFMTLLNITNTCNIPSNISDCGIDNYPCSKEQMKALHLSRIKSYQRSPSNISDWCTDNYPCSEEQMKTLHQRDSLNGKKLNKIVFHELIEQQIILPMPRLTCIIPVLPTA